MAMKTEPQTAANGIEIYLREIGRVPLLTRKEERALARRIRRGDAQAREQMIKANLRLVVKIANDYAELGLPLLDLISEGNIGLMKAVEHFNPRKGAKFSTYASWWIKQAIRRALSNQSKLIRLPVHITEKISKMKRAGFRLSEQLGRDPTAAELGQLVDLPADRVEQLRTIGTAPLSLHATVGDDADSTQLFEVIGDDRTATPYETLADRNLAGEIQALLKELDPREAEIITQRFGLDGNPPRTLEEVGRQFRVSRERIRQIQDVALAKLRRAKNQQDAVRFSLS